MYHPNRYQLLRISSSNQYLVENKSHMSIVKLPSFTSFFQQCRALLLFLAIKPISQHPLFFWYVSLHSLSTGPIHYRISWETHGLLPRDPSGDHTKEVIGGQYFFFLDKSFWQILETLLTFSFSYLPLTFRWRLHWNFWGRCHQVKLCWNFAPDSFDDDHFWSQRTRGCWKSLSSLIEGQKVNQRSQAVIFRVPIVIPDFFCKKSLIFPRKKTFQVEDNFLNICD